MGYKEIEWKKWDIHHHTIRDKSRSSEITLENYGEIIKHFSENNGNLIAITNHDEICLKSIDEYKKYIKDNNYDIKILPGAEISFYVEDPKVTSIGHKLDILLILNDNLLEEKEKIKINKINKLLDDDKYYNKKNHKLNKVNNFHNLFLQISIITNEFILIPHSCKSSNSIVNMKKNKNSIPTKEVINQLKMFYFHFYESKNISDGEIRTNKIVNELLGNKNIIFGTDLKTFTEFQKSLEKKVPWICSENSFEGLIETSKFNQRIKWPENNNFKLPSSANEFIKMIKINNKNIYLNKGLNLIIGESNSGKTNLIKSIDNYISGKKIKGKYFNIVEKIYYKNEEEFKEQDIIYIKQNDISKKISEIENKDKDLVKEWEKIIKNYLEDFTERIVKIEELKIEIVKDFSNFIKKNHNKSIIKKNILKQKYINNFSKYIDSFSNKKEIGKLDNDKKLIEYILSEIKNPKYVNSEYGYSKWIENKILEIKLFLEKKSSENEFIESNLINSLKQTKKYSDDDTKAKEYLDSKNKIIRNSEELVVKKNELFDFFKEFKNKTNEFKYTDINGINYSLKPKQEKEYFKNIINSIFLKNKILNYKKENNLLNRLLNKIILTDLKQKNRIQFKFDDPEESLEYNFYIKINGENIDLSTESSGGKQLIILKKWLYDELENKKLIIIDQPEDNLDNKKIDNVIIKGIVKEINIDKQLIIVSHDPKIILNSCSFSIIEASKIGQDKFIYKNVSKYKELKSEDYIKILDANKNYPIDRYKYYIREDINNDK